MKQDPKRLLKTGGREILTILVSFSALIGVFPVFHGALTGANTEPNAFSEPEMALIQENSLASVSSPSVEGRVTGKITALITAYSSTPDQTDDTPFVTAAGTPVRDGIIANNLLPFGTKVRIPQLYGDKIFVVEDRMNARWGNYKFDIWFEDTRSAKIFGVKSAQIEILDN